MPLRVKGKGFKYQPQGDLLINQYLKYNRGQNKDLMSYIKDTKP